MQRRHSLMLGDSREALPKIAQSKSQSTLVSKPSHAQVHPHSQRYIVPMTQNLNRRFQTPLHHEYEQRIYCLHSHYTDVIERLESQTQMQTLKLRKLEHELSEARKANSTLKVKESELRSRLQNKTDAGVSKKLVDFVDHYQQEMHRMTKETSTAQEWVVTLAELVVGPKKKHQSWDDWLNSCLEALQQRRDVQTKLAGPVQSLKC
ncbi:hypothetical protein LPJ56_006850 [Coemansia sp. RSA 2599]|nr:hypothetical protein LPJ56_006850 [Coemansia sp. RSA 2599]